MLDHLNVNSLQNKFADVIQGQFDIFIADVIQGQFDIFIAYVIQGQFDTFIADVIQGQFGIFVLSETKIDESFPDKQFCLNNFRIFRKDRSQYGGGIMFYVNENLPCKSLTTETDNLTETIFLEVNVQSSQWLFVGCYKPPSQNE